MFPTAEPTVKLTLTQQEAEFILNTLGSVTTLVTVNAGMHNLIPKIVAQSRASLEPVTLQQEAA